MKKKEAPLTIGPSGHRERLRERFRKEGFKGFHDYEVLELLLTYALPKKDMKPIAKALILRFGSLAKVLDAPLEALSEVKGVKGYAGLYLQVLRGAMAEYFAAEKRDQPVFRTLEEVVGFARARIGGLPNEVCLAMYLDSKNGLIASEDLGEGTVSETVAFPRKIAEGALKHRATAVILAHNHPGGVAEPSGNDEGLTVSVQKALRTVDVDLQEHVILSDDGFYSFRREGFFERS